MKQITLNIFRIFFYGNFHVGVLAAGLTWANGVILGNTNIYLIGLNFFSSALIYNLDRMLNLSEDFINSPQRTLFIGKYKNILIWTVILCAIVISFLIKFFSGSFLLVVFSLFMFTMLYLLIFNKRFFRFSHGPAAFQAGKHDAEMQPRISGRPDTISLLKPLMLALVWAAATVILPAFQADHLSISMVSSLFIIRFIEYGVNGVLFDYRDKEGDFLNGKSNIFLIWKKKLIFRGSLALLLLNGIIIISAIYTGLLPLVMASDLMVCIIYSVMIIVLMLGKNSEENPKGLFKSEMYYLVLLDGILFLPVIFTFFNA